MDAHDTNALLAALRESEERFRATFEQAAVGIAHVALDGRWLRVNRRLCAITGYTRDELLRLTFQDITYPDDLESDLVQAGRLLAGEIETYSLEKRYVRSDGSLLWGNRTASLVRRADESPDYFIFVVEDISARKEAEERLTRLAAIVESSDDGIVGKSIEGAILNWNAGAERIFGWSAEEAVGRPITLIIPPERWEEEEHINRRLQRGQYIEPFETVRLRKDGTSVDVSLSVSPVRDASGRMTSIAKIFRDVSRRKSAEVALRDSEARLAGIVGAATDAIITTDEERHIVLFNAAAERLFGVSATEALGSSLDRFIPPRFRAGHAHHMRAFAETGVTTRSMHRATGALPAVRADGTEFPVEATISQVVVAGRRLLTVMLRDVTDRLAAEHERERLLGAAESATQEARTLAASLEEVNREILRVAATAEAANKAKSEFLAVMSHELRTPLNAIGGYAQLLEMEIFGRVSEEQREQLGRIQRSQQHLLRVIDGVLAFTKVEVGQMTYYFENVAVGEALAGVDLLITPQAKAKAIRLEVDTQSCAVPVRADREKLRQIVLNLLSNGIKFTPVGGRVWLDCHATRDEVLVRVRDTGRGIPADQLEAIFEPFVQGDMGLTREHGGTGLGLSISRQFARAMGGDVCAQSIVGRGSTFSVRLPVVRKGEMAST